MLIWRKTALAVYYSVRPVTGTQPGMVALPCHYSAICPNMFLSIAGF